MDKIESCFKMRLTLLMGLVAALLVSCNLEDQITMTPGFPPPSVNAPVELLPSPTASVDAWQQIAPGIAQRVYRPDDNPERALLAVRFDPALYTFRAHYRPGDPLSLSGWSQALPGVIALMNANFFTREQFITGLLVADGVVYGEAYINRGGMFAVQNGLPVVRSNTLSPYRGEPLEQAIQAFPMLVLDGAAIYADQTDSRISRRTAIGQDVNGWIVFIVTLRSGLSLPALSAFLAQSDLQLVNAFNLDGGGSTMLYLNPTDFSISAFDPVPAVLAVYAR